MDNTKLEQCRKLSEEIDQLQLLEESYWHVRARTNELRDGDKNTSYFHHKASARKAKNMIVGLEDSNGQWIQDEKGISEVVTNYFSQLFTTEGVVDFDEALMGITHGITETMNDELCMVPTANEVEIALFDMHPNKAPGTDGMHDLFFQKFWHIIKNDVMTASCLPRPVLRNVQKLLGYYRFMNVLRGKKINFHKSEAVFSKNVAGSRRQEICNLLGVREVDKHERYLGIPTVIGKSKKSIFAGLKDRIWKKMQGWKEKLMSRAGKEILIKAVAQAIPTYLMGIFKIPDRLIDEIHAILTRFWWGNGAEKKMHWKKWEDLCLPKAKGGMGFRDLKIFNQALLAKQGWRLLHRKDTLLYRVLKARYFKNTEFLEAHRGYCPSFTRRSIWGARALLKEGLGWRVGDGKSIRSWHDCWLPSSSVMRPPDPPPNGLHDSDLLVYKLIDSSTSSWNETSLALHMT
ncbi:uncharacterized protein LOC110728475 [Chenopodium quinoa]|uniref:uncharacterized protein LOC110728475 n=1 Tax=Chenopodium quinoa TaxID=63459 RepID=UPI000B77475C|nr:uncharacterized protein LOC110728475 [Chenopodium quinoa]